MVESITRQQSPLNFLLKEKQEFVMVGFEVLTAVVMKFVIIWDIRPRSSLKAYWHMSTSN
jgi:hypothetical protein